MKISQLIRKGAQGRERRRSPRTPCRLNCTFQRGRKRIPARVLDVSEGGLCLLSPVALETKQRVKVHIDVPPHGPVEVEAIAWHVRRVKSGTSQRRGFSIGMMLTDTSQGFQSLLAVGSQASEAVAETSDTLAPPLTAAAAAVEETPDGSAEPLFAESSLDSEQISPEWDKWSADWDALFEESERELQQQDEVLANADLQLFRVRVKALRGPRTRTLTLNAANEQEAVASAEADLGEDWKILEITKA